MGDVVNINDKKEKLQDVVAAFTFSRLPREQRIAKTLAAVLSKIVKPSLNNEASYVADEAFFLAVGTELEPYAAKDFAVRYGHLGDGVAKT